MRRGLLVVAVVGLLGCGGEAPATPSGIEELQVVDLVVGTGAEAVNGTTATVEYTGWLYEANASENKGTQFDSSVGRAPFSFVVGVGSVIAGWDQGVAGMRVGGRRRLVIPPSLAYGNQGAGGGVIPPGATLVFDIELLSVQ